VCCCFRIVAALGLLYCFGKWEILWCVVWVEAKWVRCNEDLEDDEEFPLLQWVITMRIIRERNKKWTKNVLFEAY